MKRKNTNSMLFVGPIAVVVIIALLFLAFAGIRGISRSQDIGQVGVWTSPTKKFIKTTESTGVGSWNPFNKVTYYDIRNNTIKFSGDGKDKDKKSLNSPNIDVYNKEGVPGKMDMSVIYSIKPDKIESIWKKYPSEEKFVDEYLIQGIRSVTRSSLEDYNTIESYNKRTEIQSNLSDKLKKEFEADGIIIENVRMQSINYDKSVTDSFNEYQKESVKIETAKASKQKALIDAEKEVEVAKLTAEANRIAQKELTPEILTQQYIEAIKSTSNKVVITDGKTTLIINFSEQK